MTTKTLSPRLDLFALNVAMGKTLEQAALAANYSQSTARHSQSRLLATVGVTERIEHHKQQLHKAGEKFNVTPEWIIQRAATLATQDENPSAAVSSLRLLADVKGMTGGGAGELPPGLDKFLGMFAARASGEVSEPRTHIAGELSGPDEE